MAGENNILVVDLLPLFQEKYAELGGLDPNGKNPLFADFSSHPSVLGHRLAAQAIYEKILEENLLPNKND